MYGIQQYEQSHSKESSAVNLNVTMSVSPQDNKSSVTNSCFMGNNVRGQTSVLQSDIRPIQLDKLQKVEGKKTSHKRRRKLDFKQKRKRTKRKHNQLYYSSSSSESETESCSSSSSDDGGSNLRKCYISKKKHKKSKVKQRRDREYDGRFQVDSGAGLAGEIQG